MGCGTFAVMGAELVLPLSVTMPKPGKDVLIEVRNGGDKQLEVTAIEVSESTVPLKVNLRRFTVGPGGVHRLSVTHVGSAAGTAVLTFHSNAGSKTVQVVVDAGSGVPVNPCFAPDTCVLLSSGAARPISRLVAGDELLTVEETAHLTQRPVVETAIIERVISHDHGSGLCALGGVRVTAQHPWAVRGGGPPRFLETDELDPAHHELLACAGQESCWGSVPPARDGGVEATVWNLTTTARTYCVGGTSAGPFFVVHNVKPSRVNPGLHRH